MSRKVFVTVLSLGLIIGAGCGGSGSSKGAADIVFGGMPELAFVGDEIVLRAYELWPDGKVEPYIATWSINSVDVQVERHKHSLFLAHEGSWEIAIRSSDGRKFQRKIDVYPRVIPNLLVSTNIEKFSTLNTDDNGIPLTEVNGETGYYPINISQIAQHYFASWYVSDDPQTLRRFLVLADWLVDNCSYVDQSSCLWLTNLDVPAYRLPSPWASAMAQGQGISSLISAYWVTRERVYLDVARAAISGFQIELNNGGFRSSWYGWDYFKGTRQVYMVSDQIRVHGKFTAIVVPISGAIILLHLVQGFDLLEHFIDEREMIDELIETADGEKHP